MARHKSENWCLPEGKPNSTGGRNHSWESIHSALLMDIRDELQTLNRVFACHNAQAIPRYLRTIAGNTKRKKIGRIKL